MSRSIGVVFCELPGEEQVKAHLAMNREPFMESNKWSTVVAKDSAGSSNSYFSKP